MWGERGGAVCALQWNFTQWPGSCADRLHPTNVQLNQPKGETMATLRNGYRKETFILSVDVGTTSIRCHVYDKEAKIRGTSTSQVSLGKCQFWGWALLSPWLYPMTLIHRLAYIKRCRWILGFLSKRVYFSQVSLLYPEPGRVEMDPEDLWQSFVKVVKGAIQGLCSQSRITLWWLLLPGHCCWMLRISFYYVQIQAYRCSKWRP